MHEYNRETCGEKSGNMKENGNHKSMITKQKGKTILNIRK